MNFGFKNRLLTGLLFFFIMPIFITLSVNKAICRDLKIGYINSQRILDESKIGKEATRSIKKLEEEKTDQMALKKKEIDVLEGELRKKEFAITPEKKKEIEEEIRHKMLELKFFEETKDKEIKEKYFKTLKKIEGEVLDIVLKIGQDDGYDLILGREESGILFANPKYDLTDVVIRAYDKNSE